MQEYLEELQLWTIQINNLVFELRSTQMQLINDKLITSPVEHPRGGWH